MQNNQIVSRSSQMAEGEELYRRIMATKLFSKMDPAGLFFIIMRARSL